MGRYTQTDGESYGNDDQKAKNTAAVEEGRVLYVRGIPPDWSTEQLEEFFAHQGVVETVNLLPPKRGQSARAAFVNFETSENAENAALVCNDLPVESSSNETYRLVCDIRHVAGRKVEVVSEQTKAQQEKRSVFINGLPSGFPDHGLRRLIEPHAIIQDIEPVSSDRQACYVIVSTPQEAEQVIEKLHGMWVSGRQLTVNYPRPSKRTREPDNYIVEVLGFPAGTLPTEISYLIEAGRREVYTVEMSTGADQEPVAKVYLKSEEDVSHVIEQFHGVEMFPGRTLQARKLVENRDAKEKGEIKRKHAKNKGDSKASAIVGGPRCRGPVVGRLQRDGGAAALAGPRCRGSAIGYLRQAGAAFDPSYGSATQRSALAPRGSIGRALPFGTLPTARPSMPSVRPTSAPGVHPRPQPPRMPPPAHVRTW